MNRTDRAPGSQPDWSHEELRVVRGTRTHVTIAVAVHSTARGPAIGGCRIKSYPSWRDGVDDVLRLAEAMTLKCALAGLPHGGGKTVAIIPGEERRAANRVALITDIADVIAGLNGRYVSGPDIGTSSDDMALIHRLTGGHALCRPEAEGGSGNSNAATARGVVAALHAGLRHRVGTDSVSGRRVGVIGYGNVGRLVAAAVAREGAQVIVTDVNPLRRRDVERDGLEWATTNLLRNELDVLVPAATGGLLTRETALTIEAGLIVGPANNQIADEAAEAILHDRGITWIPDVLGSAGGIVYAVSRERLHMDDESANARVDAIGANVSSVLAHSRATSVTPMRAAQNIAFDGPAKDEKILTHG